MELRRVDPRILKQNPRNPRNIQPGEMSDAALAASIGAIGILQPPVVSEKNGELTIAYGARRVRIAIAIGLPEIDVLVKDPDDHDHMRAVSENVVRAPMATVDLWRAIESLASENWTEEAIASALAIPVRQIRKLRLLATVHPAILDQIGAGDMPKEQELRTIASASREDQAAVWKKFKPRKGEGAIWWQIAQALQKTRFFARDAKFGEAEREAFAIVWQEDLFAEGDEDNRFTIDGEAFVSAQRAWVDANMPKNGAWIEIDEYGREKLPPRANRTWAKPKKGDQIGFAIHPRDGTIHEVVFRVSEPDVKKGKDRSIGGGDDAPAPKKTRPEITQKGTEIIGALRTEALVKSLEVNACDDMTLIGLLVLAFDARNVTVQSDRPDAFDPDEARPVDHRGRPAHARRRTLARRRTPDARCRPLVLARAKRQRARRAHRGRRPRRRRACRQYGDGRLPRLPVEGRDREGRIEPPRSAAPARQGYACRSHQAGVGHDLRASGGPVRSDRGRTRAPRRGAAGIFVESDRSGEDDQDIDGDAGGEGERQDPALRRGRRRSQRRTGAR